MSIYYIDYTGGDDGDTGLTPENAWKNWTKAAGYSFDPGDNILLKKGEEWRLAANSTFPSSGTSGNPVKIGAYGSGALPTFKASEVAEDFTDEGDNLWYCSFSEEPSELFFETIAGLTIWGDTKENKVDLVNEYDWWWDDVNSRIYVYCESDPDSAYSALEGVVASRIFDLSVDFVTFEYIKLLYAVEGFRVRASNTVKVQNCEIGFMSLEGIYCYTPSGTQQNHVFKNNKVYECNDHGIYLHSSGESSIVRDIEISENEVFNVYHNNIDMLTLNAGASINGVDIKHNLVYADNPQSLGAYSGIHANSISGASTNDGIKNVRVYGNVCRKCQGAGIHFQYSVQADIIGNTIYGCDTYGGLGSMYFSTGSSSPGIDLVIKNNIIAFEANASKWALCCLDFIDFVEDYNIFYHPTGSGGRFNYINGTMYTSWSTYQAAMLAAGVGSQNSQLTDPLFMDKDNNDLTLSAQSPARESGDNSIESPYDELLYDASTWPDGVITYLQSQVGQGYEIGAYLYGLVNESLYPTTQFTLEGVEMPRYLFKDTYILRGTMTSIAADGSNSATLDLSDDSIRGGAGIIRGFRASCDSTDFTIKIFTNSDMSPNTVSEIYKAENKNLFHNENDLYVVWENTDDTISQNLYISIVNAGVMETGTISFELMLDLHSI